MSVQFSVGTDGDITAHFSCIRCQQAIEMRSGETLHCLCQQVRYAFEVGRTQDGQLYGSVHYTFTGTGPQQLQLSPGISATDAIAEAERIIAERSQLS